MGRINAVGVLLVFVSLAVIAVFGKKNKSDQSCIVLLHNIIS